MRLMNVNSVLKINTVLARFAPSQSGKMGYRWDFNEKDITIFAIERCDVCNKEVEGANSITIVSARKFVIDALHARKITHRDDIVDEIGCDDDGNGVCPDCYAEGQVNRKMLEVEAGK